MPFFRPWIQIHNVKHIEEVQNNGMQAWGYKELANRVKEVQAGDAGAAVMVMETRNFVGQFISELDLRNFPFDHQSLRITVMCNMTNDVTFSHKVPRVMDITKNPSLMASPLFHKDGDVLRTIKCNLEADTLSEWDVMLQDGKVLGAKSVAIGAPALAVVKYEFKEHDKEYSAEGAIYQRLNVHVYVKRELKNMMFSIILPTGLLSLSAISVFSLDIMEIRGERFGVLFTVILTIIANQFVTQGRLPYLAYFTWLDMVMTLFQLFVYLVVLETAIVQSIGEAVYGQGPAEADGTGPVSDFIRYCDYVGMCVLFGVFACMTLIMVGTARRAIRLRDREMAAAEEVAKESYELEEDRLYSLWFGKNAPPRPRPSPPAYKASSAAAVVPVAVVAAAARKRGSTSSKRVGALEEEDEAVPVSPEVAAVAVVAAASPTA